MTPERYEQVCRVFGEVVDLPPADRGAQLDRQCAGDPSLRAEVESLLLHHRPETVVTAVASPEAVPEAPEPEIARPDARRRLAAAFRATRRAFAAGLAAAAVIGVLWWTGRAELTRLLRAQGEARLTAMLGRTAAAAEDWLARQLTWARSVAADPEVRDRTRELVAISRNSKTPWEDIRKSTARPALFAAFRRQFSRPDLRFCTSLSPEGVGLLEAARSPDRPDEIVFQDRFLGRPVSPAGAAALRQVVLGEFVFIPPHPRWALVNGEIAEPSFPMMIFAGPIQGEDGRPVGVLALQLSCEEFFGLFPDLPGAKREIFAFGESAVLLSRLPGSDRLREFGLIPSGDAVLQLGIRDPGGDLEHGHRPADARETQPLTRLAAATVAGHDGMETEPYRNYRGVPVIGASKWFPTHKFGIAVEIPAAEAFAAVAPFDRSFGLLFALALLAPAAAFAVRAVRALRPTDGAVRIGDYLLGDKIGEGAVGIVYAARHVPLDRTVALKILRRSQMTPDSVRRFENEVRAAGRLTHPNTVSVLDFGRADDGRPFCVMEHISGLTLSQLVRSEGPQPPGRVIHLLKQIAASLEEAHSLGLLHRDIKPHNIMLCRRGLQDDVIKVLDFGLAKDVRDADDLKRTATVGIAGTPVYISPERFRDPRCADPRSDLYSLGAVGYKLLCGRAVFQGHSATELLYQTIAATPRRPHEVLDVPVSPRLERLILQCLAKDPADRPQSARVIIEALDSIEDVDPWRAEDARKWWDLHLMADVPGAAPGGRDAGTAHSAANP